jgi:hypothetical protein
MQQQTLAGGLSLSLSLPVACCFSVATVLFPRSLAGSIDQEENVSYQLLAQNKNREKTQKREKKKKKDFFSFLFFSFFSFFLHTLARTEHDWTVSHLPKKKTPNSMHTSCHSELMQFQTMRLCVVLGNLIFNFHK